MSFTNVKSLTSTRFSEVQLFLNYIKSQEPGNPTDPTPIEVKIMRGLFYVHLYSTLEKSINEVVQKTLLLINAQNVKNNHFTLAFNTISVLDKLKSLKDCSHKNFVDKSVQLFDEVGSRNIRTINETAFSNNLQNVWMNTIEEILSAFGIKNIEIQARQKATIDEIVDKRNAVAHGRESASYVGERHRTDILRTKLDIAQNFTIQIIDTFDEYIENKKYLKPITKKYYV